MTATPRPSVSRSLPKSAAKPGTSCGIFRLCVVINKDRFENRSGDSSFSSLSDWEKFPEIARVEAWSDAVKESASLIPMARIN